MKKILILILIIFNFSNEQNSKVLAQVIPDKTLPTNTQINHEGETYLINGGTVKGKNLYHSFESLSIRNGETAQFNNPQGIINILSRITGNSVSSIDGIIKTNYQSNFFFINPNGIIFNSNARLKIGGSFIGTTANSILFPGGNNYGK